MFIGKSAEISRRAFLRRSSQLAVAGSAASYAMGLAGVAEAAGFSAGNDYKALVCVFLYGGNDHNDTLIPYDAANYARYQQIRTQIARSQSSLAATALPNPSGQTLTDNLNYALAPEMPLLAAKYRAGNMAPLLNVGPLLTPLTKAQYRSNSASYPKPPRLFSHNDQQSTWQSSSPEGSVTGWGGRMGDLAQSSNSNAIFTCISATGNAVFLSGQNALAYQVSGNGAVAVKGVKSPLFGSGVASQALSSLMSQSSGHVLEADYTRISKRSIETEAFVSSALSPVSLATNFTQTGGNSLASQLQVVARLIAARNTMGVKRQVFMVSLGGFDNHDDLSTKHAQLLGNLDFALNAFYDATVELGVADKVTTFTASDFGRTLTSNGDGSDHGWGSHHFIMGDAVKGGRFYGTAPQVSVDSDDQVGNGRLLPTTSVDELSSTLALWFGVAPSELPTVTPNIGRFANPNLGFMG